LHFNNQESSQVFKKYLPHDIKVIAIMNTKNFLFKPNIMLSLIISSMMMGTTFCNAEEKKSYTRPPVSSFSSQMSDALTGSGKYEKPVWNLHDALKLPDWLSLSVEQRTRYETMDGRFNAGGRGGDQQIATQIDVFMEARFDKWRVGGEFLDARQWGSDAGSVLNNTHVNTAEMLQGYVAWADQNAFYSGLGAEVIAGRQTLNIGSRRLVARNAFRNTINTFDGLRVRVTNYDNWQVNAFVTMPVNRYPTSAADLLNNVQDFDKADGHTWFSGVFLEGFNLVGKMNGELYLYHLDEGDSPTVATRNRRYFTPGLRFYLKPAKGQFDFQVESIGQFGTVKKDNTPNSPSYSHTAWYQHLDAGYTFDIPWSPRFSAEYDYASGDKNPNDSKDQRFDSLYGGRRFEYAPTGIYGAFSRGNLNTPGYRLGVSPLPNVQAGLAHRFYWLAESRDAWVGSNLQNRNGTSGDFIGHQLELTTRWDVNSSLNLETGWTHLFKGEFAKSALAGAPQGVNVQDVDYFYVQSMLRF
jgi:Alginate export